MSRMGTIFVSVSFVVAMLSFGFAAIYDSKCTDGTPYGKCSETYPGSLCWSDSAAASGVSIQDIMGPSCPFAVSVCEQYREKCSCDKYGYILVNDKCVPPTCKTSTGVQIENGKCVSKEPTRCVNGELVGDATCGCPVGQQSSTDGKSCVPVPNSCRWNTKECDKGYECSFVESNEKDEGHCKAVSGCAEFIPKETKVSCPTAKKCDTNSNPNGVCVDMCSSSQVYNTNTKKCESKVAPKTSETEMIDTPTAGAISSDLACCCAPAVGIVGLAGLAAFRRRE